MAESILGIIVSALMAIAGFFVGRKVEREKAAVHDEDIIEGIVKRVQKRKDAISTVQQIEYQAKQEAERISKKLKEAPNEEIVDMFMDAFADPPPNGSTGAKRGGPRPKRVRRRDG